jgi:hypothetical protein
LVQSGVNLPGIGIGHALNPNRIFSPDPNISNFYFPGGHSLGHGKFSCITLNPLCKHHDFKYTQLNPDITMTFKTVRQQEG